MHHAFADRTSLVPAQPSLPRLNLTGVTTSLNSRSQLVHLGTSSMAVLCLKFRYNFVILLLAHAVPNGLCAPPGVLSTHRSFVFELNRADSRNDAADRVVCWRLGIPDVFPPCAMGQTYRGDELRWSLDRA